MLMTLSEIWLNVRYCNAGFYDCMLSTNSVLYHFRFQFLQSNSNFLSFRSNYLQSLLCVASSDVEITNLNYKQASVCRMG
jgi:hypothetical protein